MKEPRKVRWNVLAALEIITNTTSFQHLEFKKTKNYILSVERLKKYFGNISEIQVIILSNIIYCIFSRSSTDSHINDFSIYSALGITAFKYLQYTKEIEDLDNRGLIELRMENTKHLYSINSEIFYSITQNREINIQKEQLDPVAFIQKIGVIIHHSINYQERIYELKSFEKKNISIPFVKKLSVIFPSSFERFCFYFICREYICGWDAHLENCFQLIYDSNATRRMKDILFGNYSLLKKGFIDFVIKGNVIDSTLTITEKAKSFVFGNDEYLFERKINEKSLIFPEKIVSKQLFYSKENQQQINLLYSSLSKENFSNIQNGLKSRGFPTGVCILLYGSPGTGKTESVYQIAKATNRQIVHVDISQTKSCWLGESEKLIQKIFDDYKNMCQKLKLNGKNDCPILLFNEADAIIQKRTEFSGGGAEKTENAMQNILLENLEKFDGIMIATTNLEINMDAAFERRFLYKIKFENPTIEAKTSIWQSKLNWLPEAQAKQLANEYNFSGGEIDNIVRKATMEEILNGSKVTLNRLVELCKSEKLISCNAEKKMGFCM